MLEINCEAKPVGIPMELPACPSSSKWVITITIWYFHNPKTMQSISSLYG